MIPEFWKARWETGRIGFHEGAPNALLVRHAACLDANGPGRAPLPGSPSPSTRARTRVLVPLAGKSVDVAYLASLGHEVVAVELVASAVEAFFREQGLEPIIEQVGELVRYTAGPITFFAGDYFATTSAAIGQVNALYDRAALIALPEEMRTRYVAHTRSLLSPDYAGLLISFEYDPAKRATPPPPHAVWEPEIRSLFAPPDATPTRQVTLLEETDGRSEAQRAEGAPLLTEKAWKLAIA